ncbi:MAG: hypothetical protein R3B52_02320 [Candidatus Paceibacterota bacterium]
MKTFYAAFTSLFSLVILLLSGSTAHAAALGADWTQATSSANWSGRETYSVSFDDKIWVLGGYSTGYLNDVWYSEDGASWTQATASADWSTRSYFTTAVFDDKMWVIGGHSGGRVNDVWHSEDGVSWTEATSSAEWTERYGHSSVVFDNKL